MKALQDMISQHSASSQSTASDIKMQLQQKLQEFQLASKGQAQNLSPGSLAESMNALGQVEGVMSRMRSTQNQIAGIMPAVQQTMASPTTPPTD